MARKTESKDNEIQIVELKQEDVTFCILGVTPFYCNRVAEKAKRELLFPRGRLTTAQKSENLKHDPVTEFRDSPYVSRGEGPTRIMMKATAFKGAIAQAAIDMPTAVAKTQINRLTYVLDEFVPIWGVPLLDMDVVRSADMNRTPDIRTRAKLMEWASIVRVRYTKPMLTAQKVATLLAASGMIVGIGDFRQEKGKGNNGLFQIVDQNDPKFLRITQSGGTLVQDEALANPVCSNAESEDLLDWYLEEVVNRRDTQKGSQKSKRTNGKSEGDVQDAAH